MNPISVIERYYEPGSLTHGIMVEHGRMVAQKAVNIALKLGSASAQVRFIEEAALLHDIAIFLTSGPSIGCHGNKEYVCHGYLGWELLRSELPRHALVCERHVAAGISLNEILERNLPLPPRDMLPLSLEEKIICYADKFFSKIPGALQVEKPLEEVRHGLSRYGAEQLRRFDEMHELFSR